MQLDLDKKCKCDTGEEIVCAEHDGWVRISATLLGAAGAQLLLYKTPL